MRLLAAIVVLFCAFPALAEPDWQTPFRKYVTSTAYLNEVGQQIARLEKRFAPGCTGTLRGMKRMELRLIEQPSFIPGLPIPQGGQWQEQMEIDRCGKPVLHNVLVTATAGSSPYMTVLLPGTSKANGRLQVDASSAVFAVAGARAGEGCTDGARHIVDARFQRYLGRSASLPPRDRLWREIWTVAVCDRTIRVQVDFAPDGAGSFTHQVDLPETDG
ncbi:hypothetical protein [Minwuia sp.]|uniref:hypothetical protein n=1 Tax=Minwuia sp. TaxID=2493630 RepID=UPI003A8EA9E8